MDLKYKNKRGSYLDIFWLIVVVFALGIVIIVGWLVMSSVNDELQTKLSHTEATTIMQENTDRYVNLFDGIFLFVFFGSFLATLIGSLFLDTHPAFFIISLILLIVVCVVAAALANAYHGVATNAAMVSYADDFSYMPFIFEYYVHILIFMVCSISIALYGKSRWG